MMALSMKEKKSLTDLTSTLFIPMRIKLDGGAMDTTNNAAWETLTPENKRRALYDRQVATLKTFLEHGAITQA